MQTPACPKCGNTTPPDDINVAGDVAFCRACNFSTSLSALTRDLVHDPNIDLGNPPPGTWYRDNGSEKVIGASARSAGKAIGMFFIALIWNGVIALFVMFVLVATLKNLGRPIPGWIPGPIAGTGGDIKNWMSICMWLFLTPFLLIGIALPFAMLMNIAGHTEVRIADTGGTVFNGIGFFGRRWRFNPASVAAVRVAQKRMHGSMRHRDDRDTFSNYIAIELRDGNPIEFGFSLTDKRMMFVVSALNAALNLDGTRR